MKVLSKVKAFLNVATKAALGHFSSVRDIIFVSSSASYEFTLQERYTMKSLILSTLLLTLGFTASHAQVALEDYTAGNDGWHVIVEDAFQESERTGKPIMANFTGSDWCGWCKRLTASVFSKSDFQTWADENVVLLELDYPRRSQVPSEIKAQNNSLRSAFGIRGYPTIWIFDLEKDENGQYSVSAHGKTGYSPTVAEFTDAADQIIAQRSKS